MRHVGALPAGEFSGVSFRLPAQLLKDKLEVTLRVPAQSKPVGGIYECRIVTNAR